MAKARTQRRLAAILAADVVGYSRLVRRDEAGTLARLKRLRAESIEPKIAAYGGRIFKLMGDGMLAEFASAVDAVAFAAESQQAVTSLNSDLPEEERISFRIGVNLGDVVIDGDDIHGDGVNVAARLEGLAEPGGICISGSVYEQIRDRIDFGFEDMGEQVVKNLDRPVRAWRWRTEDEVRPDAPAASSAAARRPEKPSIAVLPFDNMSADPEQEFFADGIAEDIITALSKVLAMRVIARNSTFAYKGKAVDLRQIAGELGVRYVLEGSVRRAGQRLRITAQLIDAADGSHLWAERYDRVADDLFDIQDEITKEIVTALRVKLTDGEQALIWARGTQNIEAWQHCVRASELFLRFNSTDYIEARRLAERATELDPDYAHAWATLGFTWWWDARLGFTGESDAKFGKAAEFAERAMALDDTVSSAIGLSALVAGALNRFEEGIAIAERGFAYHPGNADVRAFLGVALLQAGRYKDAVGHIRAALALNPFAPDWYRNGLCRSLTMMDHLDEALKLACDIIDADPTHLQSRVIRAYVLRRFGRLDEAGEAIHDLRQMAPRLRVSHLQRLLLQRPDEAMQRFADVLREAGLPD